MNEKEFLDLYPYTWPDFSRLFKDSYGSVGIDLPVRVLEITQTADDSPVYNYGQLRGFVRNGPAVVELRAIDASGRVEMIVVSDDGGHRWHAKNMLMHAEPAYRDFVAHRERVEDKSPPIDLATEARRAIAKAKKAFEE